jgi:hypothetical protein
MSLIILIAAIAAALYGMARALRPGPRWEYRNCDLREHHSNWWRARR